MKLWIVKVGEDGRLINSIPVHELVLCKNCKNQGTYDCHITALTGQTSADEWYCADGEKKEEC